MPLRNTTVIGRGFAAHHARTVVGGMTALVRLSRPERLGTRDPESGRTPTSPPVAYYEGPGRVQASGGITPASSAADRDVATGPYLVAVPVDVGGVPLLGDLVDVLDSRDDPILSGLRLYVDEIPTASIRLQRDLRCTLTAPANPTR